MRSWFSIAPYAITPRGRGYALWLDGDCVEAGFETEADAYSYAHMLLDDAEDEDAAQADHDAADQAEAA